MDAEALRIRGHPVVVQLILQGEFKTSDRLWPPRCGQMMVDESACQARAVSMRSGLSPERSASALRCRNSASRSSSLTRQSAVCTTSYEVHLVTYVRKGRATHP